jgi:putative FmdB family regulatory protein
MPVYEVECTACQKEGEFVAKISDRDITPSCSHCGAPTKRIISAVRGFVYFPAAGGQGYVSPTSGKYIDTKRARVEDLKRSGCRPYEGFEQEKKEAARQVAHEEKKADAKLEESVRKAYYELPPEKRAVLNQ